MKTVVFDIETTGLPPKGADYKIDFLNFPYIVTFAWKVNDQETKQFVVNQDGRAIPEESTKIHGITDAMADESPWNLSDVISNFICDCTGADKTIGHNIYFDSSMIKANVLRLYDLGCINADVVADIDNILHKDRRIDTMKGTIKFCALPKSKWPRLTELHEKLFPGESFNAHNSKDDVEATYKCYIKLKELGIL